MDDLETKPKTKLIEVSVTDEWPADNPNIKDPLLRHSFERCLQDDLYRQNNRKWFEWAHGEMQRRARQPEIENQLNARADRAIAAYCARSEAHAKHHQADLDAKSLQRKQEYDERQLRMVRNTI